MEAKGAAKDKSFLEEGFLVRPCQSSLQERDTCWHTEQKKKQRTGGSRSPFPRVETAGVEGVVSMLLDTGADISLLSHDRLSARRAATIQPSQRCNPMAATGHEVQVIRTLRLTVRARELVINNHPFLVVRYLILPFIGGVDFLSRLVTQTWDWENRTLLVCGRKLRPESMYRNSSSVDSPMKPIQSCQVIVANDVRVQPDDEALVPCSLKRAVPNTEYLLGPQRQQDEYPMRAMCCLIRPADESATIRLVNCGTQEEVVCTGQTVGMAFPEIEAVLQSVVGKGDHRSVSRYEIETRLERNKQQEITDLINKYGDIYWQEGDQLPTINFASGACNASETECHTTVGETTQTCSRHSEESTKGD